MDEVLELYETMEMFLVLMAGFLIALIGTVAIFTFFTLQQYVYKHFLLWLMQKNDKFTSNMLFHKYYWLGPLFNRCFLLHLKQYFINRYTQDLNSYELQLRLIFQK